MHVVNILQLGFSDKPEETPRVVMTLQGHPHQVIERAHEIGHALLRDKGSWRFESIVLLPYVPMALDSDATFGIVVAVKEGFPEPRGF